MIIVFHTLYFLVRYLRKIYKESQEAKAGCHLIGSEVRFQSSITVDDGFNVRFDPPLFKQRYATVQQILLNEKYRPRIKKIVDFGCSELSFFIYLKHLFGVTEILCVDSDENVLRENLFKINPLNVDFLKKRSEKLNVQVLHGSVSDPDYRLKGVDAVIAIELIEHLYPDTLDAFPYNIFGFIRPLLVIITTPNSEFNVIFKRDGFRHFDHKFEWNREQFQDWCNNITKRFPNYHVYFDGIGNPPDDNNSIGHCTQYAVFLKDSSTQESPSLDELTPPAEPLGANKESFGVCTYYSYTKQLQTYENLESSHSNGVYYKEIDSVDYPFQMDNRTPEKRILDEVLYKIYSIATPHSRFYNEDMERIEMPLYMLISNEEGCYTTASEVRTILERENFRVEECLERGREEKTLCVIYELDTMNNRNSSSEDADSNDEQPFKIPWAMTALEESEWDAEYTHGVKVNEEKVQDEKPIEKITNQQSTSEDNKITFQYQSVIPEKSNEKKPKKGTNIKNRHQPSTSYAQKNDLKTTKTVDTFKITKVDSPQTSSQESSNKNVKNKAGLKTITKTKLISSPKSPRIEDSTPSTSDPKRKRKKSDENKEDIKNMFECFVYNTLNTIDVPEESTEDQIPISNDQSTYSDIKELMELDSANLMEANQMEINKIETNQIEINQMKANQMEINQIETERFNCDGLAKDLIEDILVNLTTEGSDIKSEKSDQTTTNENTSQELNMASREALFDPNSEIDMLEEFGIPPEVNNEENGREGVLQPNVILIGVHLNNDEDGVAIPDNADPFPNWLLQLLGANVEEVGESHDEPHFYCQGDGIGVHPSIIEVELDEEESSSDSTSSNDQAEAERTISESVVGALPNDELENSEPIENPSRPNSATPGSTTESTDEFYDTIEEHTTYNTDSSKTTNDA